MASPHDRQKSDTQEEAGGDATPSSVEQALSKSLRHARRAITEGLLAARSLLDAASLALAGKPAVLEPGEQRGATDVRLIVATVARGLDELIAATESPEGDLPLPVIEAILGALDTEVTRWEKLSRTDPDARAVLRAFLGMREILWELGLRDREEAGKPESSNSQQASPPSSDTAATRPDDPGSTTKHEEARPRVQRVQIRG